MAQNSPRAPAPPRRPRFPRRAAGSKSRAPLGLAIGALAFGLLAGGLWARAQETGAGIERSTAARERESLPAVAPSPTSVPVPPDPMAAEREHGHPTPWLDEVRAQRRAREERRQSARDAFEARRRLANPEGAAHQEAWEEDVKRRRGARLKQMEEQRERFRGLGPGEPYLPWPDLGSAPFPRSALPPLPGPAMPDRTPADGAPGADGAHAGAGFVYPPPAPLGAPYSPQDWNNLWYYRGY